MATKTLKELPPYWTMVGINLDAIGNSAIVLVRAVLALVLLALAGPCELISYIQKECQL
jgi:hypothetical protein